MNQSFIADHFNSSNDANDSTMKQACLVYPRIYHLDSLVYGVKLYMDDV
jgi:meiotically up-regulated gene 157 (Mug157) protein